MVESPAHKHGKERLAQIIKIAGFTNISLEVQQPKTMLEYLGERGYIADIEAEKEGQSYIFEVDGKLGHSTRRNKSKDKGRDRAMLEHSKRTIRILTIDLIGKRKLSDREILKEIEWQLTNIQTIEENKNVLSVINC